MSTKPETPQYFYKNIWPNHQQYKTKIFGENIQNQDDQIGIKDKLLILDGTSSIESCIKKSLTHIGRKDIISEQEK